MIWSDGGDTNLDRMPASGSHWRVGPDGCLHVLWLGCIDHLCIWVRVERLPRKRKENT